jgi:hypothetical protein
LSKHRHLVCFCFEGLLPGGAGTMKNTTTRYQRRSLDPSRKPRKVIKRPTAATIDQLYRELRQLRERLVEVEAQRNGA